MTNSQLKHFMIRAVGDEAAEEALNRFLRGHHILELRQEFVADGSNSAWYIAVRYAEAGGQGPNAVATGAKRKAVDYKDILDAETFDRFAELRRRRKRIAETEGIPVFAVFTNEELAGIARLENLEPGDLKAIMNVCEPYFERIQIFDSYACRKGKGTRAALFRAQGFGRRYPCFLKLDVRKYFHSIEHVRLKGQLGRMFKDARLMALLEAVIDGHTNEPGRGLPIGNLTSQSFANHYLAGLDHYLKEQLRVPGYLRYMDDFVLWGRSTAELLSWERQARIFCRNHLGLELKPPCVNRSSAGLPFLGFLVRPGALRLSSRSCRRLRHKLKSCLKNFDRGNINENRAAMTVRSLFARTDWAGGATLRRRLSANDFGRRPRARTASTAAVAGTATRVTAAVPTATTGNPTSATTTSASAWSWPPAQQNRRMSSIDPGGDPVLVIQHGLQDEVNHDGRVPVARVDAGIERSRPSILAGPATGEENSP